MDVLSEFPDEHTMNINQYILMMYMAVQYTGSLPLPPEECYIIVFIA